MDRAAFTSSALLKVRPAGRTIVSVNSSLSAQRTPVSEEGPEGAAESLNSALPVAKSFDSKEAVDVDLSSFQLRFDLAVMLPVVDSLQMSFVTSLTLATVPSSVIPLANIPLSWIV